MRENGVYIPPTDLLPSIQPRENVKRSARVWCMQANDSPVALQPFHTRLFCARKEACLRAFPEDIEDDIHPAA